MNLVSLKPETHIENGRVVRLFPPRENFLVRCYDWLEKPLVAKINITVTCAIMLTCMFLAGCAHLRDNPAAAKLGVQYAVSKYIANSAVDKREDRKTRIINIATEIKTSAADQAIGLDALTAIAYARIDNLTLDAPDRVLARGLVDFIAEELRSRIKQNLLSPDDVVTIRAVMDWIIDAAKLS